MHLCLFYRCSEDGLELQEYSEVLKIVKMARGVALASKYSRVLCECSDVLTQHVRLDVDTHRVLS